MAAVQAANRKGVLVSFDLNYRSKLWSEADARDAFVAIVPKVDILFASRGGLGTFFGIDGSHEEVMRAAIERLGVAAVTVTRKRAKGSRRLRAAEPGDGTSPGCWRTPNGATSRWSTALVGAMPSPRASWRDISRTRPGSPVP